MPRMNIPVTVPRGSKFCHACQTVHPISEFYSSRNRPDGLHTQCKECHKETSRKSRERRKPILEAVAAVRARPVTTEPKFQLPPEPDFEVRP